MTKIKYKGKTYEKGNEYNNLVELYEKGILVNTVRRLKNGMYRKL